MHTFDYVSLLRSRLNSCDPVFASLPVGQLKTKMCSPLCCDVSYIVYWCSLVQRHLCWGGGPVDFLHFVMLVTPLTLSYIMSNNDRHVVSLLPGCSEILTKVLTPGG